MPPGGHAVPTDAGAYIGHEPELARQTIPSGVQQGDVRVVGCRDPADGRLGGTAAAADRRTPRAGPAEIGAPMTTSGARPGRTADGVHQAAVHPDHSRR